MQKAFYILTKLVEVSLSLLERTWIGSVVEALVGKAIVASALFGSLRSLKNVEITYCSRTQQRRVK